MDSGLGVDRDSIRIFCERRHIRWLAVFGWPRVDLGTPQNLSRYFRDDVVAPAEIQHVHG